MPATHERLRFSDVISSGAARPHMRARGPRHRWSVPAMPEWGGEMFCTLRVRERPVPRDGYAGVGPTSPGLARHTTVASALVRHGRQHLHVHDARCDDAARASAASPTHQEVRRASCADISYGWAVDLRHPPLTDLTLIAGASGDLDKSARLRGRDPSLAAHRRRGNEVRRDATGRRGTPGGTSRPRGLACVRAPEARRSPQRPDRTPLWGDTLLSTRRRPPTFAKSSRSAEVYEKRDRTAIDRLRGRHARRFHFARHCAITGAHRPTAPPTPIRPTRRTGFHSTIWPGSPLNLTDANHRPAFPRFHARSTRSGRVPCSDFSPEERRQ